MTALPEIESRFDVLAKLGEGGMGCVYKVRHRDLDEIQIVKTLQAHLSSNEGLRERFINEARRGMRLRHPHIAGVHDFAVCADGTGYIVMEYVHGHNLRDLLATRGPLRLELVGVIAVQTLDALSYLHSEKFIHRDISPDNLILTNTAEGKPFVKLIDLGISKSLESGNTMTGTGQFIGKVSYASPEQFGGHADERSDLYSLGVVLYKLLTNSEPFPGENYNQIIAGHLFQPPRPLPPEIPEPVQQVIYRALEKDPDKRFASADEFCAAVEEAFGIDEPRVTRPAVTRPAITRTPTAMHTPEGATTVVPLTDKTVVSAPTEAGTTLVEPLGGVRPQPKLTRYVVLGVIAIALTIAAVLVWQRMHAATLASYGKFYAVVIGESKYVKYESLPTAVNDARAIANLLRTKYGYDVTLLENATQQQIITALQASAKKTTANDNLLVYYAGHGTVLNGQGYWKPVDADLEMINWISPTNIKDVLIDHPPKRMLILADSCYSGALARGALNAQATKEKKSRLVISSGGDAPVIDSADGKHSLFTGALLDVLGDPKADVADVQSLFAPIRERVNDSARRAGFDQNPDLGVMTGVGDEGGAFYFVSR